MDTGTGQTLPGHVNDPNTTYTKIYNPDGSVMLLYGNGATYTYTDSYQQWSVPDANGGTTTYTRDIHNPTTPNASYGDWVTQHITANGVIDTTGTVAAPKDQIAIASGDNSVTVTLIDAGNSTTADKFNLTASITDASGAVTSNTLAVTFDSPNPNVAGTATNTINGDQTPMQYTDANGNTYYKTNANGNLITGGSSDPGFNDVLYGDGGNDVINTGGGSNIVNGMGGNDTINGGPGNDVILGGDMNGGNAVPANVSYSGSQIGQDPTPNSYTNNGGNGNNLINGNGGQDVIIVGNGNNQIYAGTQVDLATALTDQKTATVSNQKGDLIAVGDGNNTLVGGTGNDDIFMGAGNNTLVLGNGNNTVSGGIEITSANPDWSATQSNAYPYVDSYSGITGTSAPYKALPNYNGNYYGASPVGLGNDTIYGGSGNSTYWLSNGTAEGSLRSSGVPTGVPLAGATGWMPGAATTRAMQQ